MMTITQKNLLLVGCVSAVVIPVVVAFYFWLEPIDRTTRPEVICVANLKQIDVGKQIWVIEQHKTTNDIATWNDIWTSSSGGVPPKCPGGGSYTIGRIGDTPSCSVSAHTALYRTERR